LQEIQTRGPSVERTIGAKSSRHGEAEGLRIKGDGRGEIGDIDIYE